MDGGDRKPTGPRLSQGVLTLTVEEGASLDATAYCGSILRSAFPSLTTLIQKTFQDHSRVSVGAYIHD